MVPKDEEDLFKLCRLSGKEFEVRLVVYKTSNITCKNEVRR